MIIVIIIIIIVIGSGQYLFHDVGSGAVGLIPIPQHNRNKVL